MGLFRNIWDSLTGANVPVVSKATNTKTPASPHPAKKVDDPLIGLPAVLNGFTVMHDARIGVSNGHGHEMDWLMRTAHKDPTHETDLTS